MYSIVKGIKLSNNECSYERDIILVDRESARILQNVWHQMSIGHRGKWTIFNYNSNVLSALKRMEVNQDETDHSALFKLEENKTKREEKEVE